MSDYKGFIDYSEYLRLKLKLDAICEADGIYNKLHHLYQPDTDMDDKLCESLPNSKFSLVRDLNRKKLGIDNLIKHILALS